MMWYSVLLSFITLQLSSSFNLTILHTNDVGARLDSFNAKGLPCSEEDKIKNECFGGAARMMTALKHFRQKHKHLLFLDAGDQYQGSLYYTFLKWKPIAEIMIKLRYDAMSFGNHEFDDGLDGLTPFLKTVKLKFPVLATNLESVDEEFEELFQKSAIIPMGWQKIGLLGYITPATPTISSPGSLLWFRPEVPALQQAADKLKAQGISIIIAVGHSGFSMDKKICREVDGVDVVVGGHTNTFLYNGTPPSNEKPVDVYPFVVEKDNGRKCLVVQDYGFAKYLGFLQVEFDSEGNVKSWGGNPVLIDNVYPPDSEISQTLEKYSKQLEIYKKKHIGITSSAIDGTRENCRQRECNMGNLITDAVVHAFQKPPRNQRRKHWVKSAAAITNGGGIRNSLTLEPWSNITQGDLYTVLPFGSQYSRIVLKGKHIRQAFEHSASFLLQEDLEGGFLQVSGFKVVYDDRRPVGSRVVSLKILCADCLIPRYQKVINNKEYCIITNDFLIRGGDGYSVISKNVKKGTDYDLELLDIDIMTSYVKKFQPIKAEIEGRSIRLSENNVDCPDSGESNKNIALFGMVMTVLIIFVR